MFFWVQALDLPPQHPAVDVGAEERTGETVKYSHSLTGNQPTASASVAVVQGKRFSHSK